MFRTRYDENVRYYSNSGSPTEHQRKLKVDEYGRKELVIVGEIDSFGMIQSHKDSVDINLILDRFARGDASVLNKVQGVFGDFTSMPKTLAELSQRVLDAEQLFSNLPLEIREEFGHDPSQFFASIGSEKYNKAIEKSNLNITNLEASKNAEAYEKAVNERAKFNIDVKNAQDSLTKGADLSE